MRADRLTRVDETCFFSPRTDLGVSSDTSKRFGKYRVSRTDRIFFFSFPPARLNDVFGVSIFRNGVFGSQKTREFSCFSSSLKRYGYDRLHSRRRIFIPFINRYKIQTLKSLSECNSLEPISVAILNVFFFFFFSR